MDEYDVYMDEISRKLTLDQLKKYSMNEDQINKQFLIITPHKIPDVVTSERVRIVMMPEPVRNSAVGLQQTTL